MVNGRLDGYPRRNRRLAFAALLAVVALAYYPAFHAGYIWDDDSYVTANPTLALPGAEGLRRIWFEPRSSPQYYPVVFTSFWAETAAGGFRPALSHFVNILLHGINAALIFALLSRLGVPLAWLSAAIFALHPVHVETVAWIAERKNLLSACFTLIAALCYLRPSLLEPTARETAQPAHPSPGAWSAAFAAFVVALLSKSVAATLPLSILIVLWWRRGRVHRADVLPLLPFFATGAAAGWFTSWLERTHVGATGPLWSFTPLERLVIAGKDVCFYLGKGWLPYPLMFVYPRWEPHGFPAWHLLAPASVVALVVVLWRARLRLGRGPLAATLFFLVTVAPALGFVNFYPMQYSFVADHFQYLALLGPVLLAAGGIDRVLQHLPGPTTTSTARRAPEPARVALLSMALLLGCLTFVRSAAFRDEETLWRDTIAKNPDATLARTNLGVLLAKQGRHREALEQFAVGLRLAPGSADILTDQGTVLRALGRAAEAEQSYRAALDADPAFTMAHTSLASLLLERGSFAEALARVNLAARLDPDCKDLELARGMALAGLGDEAGAFAAAERAVQQQPEQVEANLFFGTRLASVGQWGAAEKHLEKALTADPGNAAALYNLGLVHDARGELPQAIDYYRKALSRAPLANAHNNLGIDLATSGRTAEAETHFREAIRLRPGYREAQLNLERLLKPPSPLPEGRAPNARH